ncbi:hypothetical protein TrRE_jg2862 [Triparma retinervis]|uniref:Uncharacterized protein n=1 Tax=Triparma retinervis TaxID=2557542 RepID=A0A9W7CM86_9STRA|nr:hypothetical protein TrRE_jg2862 [Triparma retinervis]
MSDEEYARQLYEGDLKSISSSSFTTSAADAGNTASAFSSSLPTPLLDEGVRQADERRTERLVNPPPQLPSISSILSSGVEGLSALDEIISSRIQQSSYYDSGNDLFVQMAARGLSTTLDLNPNPTTTSSFSHSGTEDEELAKAIAASLPITSSPPYPTATASTLHGEDDELARAIASSMLPQNSQLQAAMAGAETTEDLIAAAIAASLVP